MLCAFCFFSSLHSQYTPEAYIARFKPVADSLSCIYGVPSAIILAQACLESGFGNSKAARERNNHLGIDKGKRVFSTADSSFIEHSIMLTTMKRYRTLLDVPVTDYLGWAVGLQLAGYATDTAYSEKLLLIIERYGLMG